ncbi:MAG: BolA family transcriptional regulator [Alphaproteobacteria bacterium]|nr:BolA family transcriptional regulator [Alphaproteobacteria bacterium]MBF0392993.1 BolA family transcriptional regulator [Alphaproteobacteria bacterium]
MTIREGMERKLAGALAPQSLEIIDQSHRHAGHAGANPQGESHFHVQIVSQAFAGKSRVERQRMVHAVLADELSGRVHALTLATLTPEEAAALRPA